MKSKIVATFLVALFSCGLFSMEFDGGDESGSGGSRVGGGGGLSEINLIYAWTNFTFYLNEIEAIEVIKLNAQELKIIEQLLTTAPLEKSHAHLIFLTQDQYKFPETLYHQTFTVGEDISFNINQLFNKDEKNDERPFTLSDSIALLIKIFDRGRTTDTKVLTTLTNKVQYFLNSNSTLFNLSKLNRNELQIENLNIQNDDEVLAIDSFSMKNLTPIINKSLICDKAIPSSKIKLLNFYNLYFQSIAKTDIDHNSQKIILAGSIIYQCDNQIAEGDFSLTLNYQLIPPLKSKLTKDWWSNPHIKAELNLSQTRLDLKDLVFKGQ